jgi:hypothetical protein
MENVGIFPRSGMVYQSKSGNPEAFTGPPHLLSHSGSFCRLNFGFYSL